MSVLMKKTIGEIAAAKPDVARLFEHIHLENNVLFPRALALDVAADAEHATAGGAQR